MQRPRVVLAASGIAAMFAGCTGAMAQGCLARSGDGSASSRDGALRAAFEVMLRATDAAALQRWNATGRRVGDAPGYTIVKMTSTCTPAGSGYTCRISATLCRK